METLQLELSFATIQPDPKAAVKRDWVVRAYAVDGHLVRYWSIENQTEQEASKEAEEKVRRLGSRVDDWTLMPS